MSRAACQASPWRGLHPCGHRRRRAATSETRACPGVLGDQPRGVDARRSTLSRPRAATPVSAGLPPMPAIRESRIRCEAAASPAGARRAVAEQVAPKRREPSSRRSASECTRSGEAADATRAAIRRARASCGREVCGTQRGRLRRRAARSGRAVERVTATGRRFVELPALEFRRLGRAYGWSAPSTGVTPLASLADRSIGVERQRTRACVERAMQWHRRRARPGSSRRPVNRAGLAADVRRVPPKHEARSGAANGFREALSARKAHGRQKKLPIVNSKTLDSSYGSG